MEPVRHFPIEILYGLLAVMGGIARYLNGYVGGTKFQMTMLVASAFVAGFSGFMFALLGDSMSLPLPLPSIMAGVGGFMGDQTMKLIMEVVTKKVS